MTGPEFPEEVVLPDGKNKLVLINRKQEWDVKGSITIVQELGVYSLVKIYSSNKKGE